MKRFCTFRNTGVVCGAVLILAALAARAEGPLLVGGPAFVEGVPFRWNINPLTYWTDLGQLGNQSNTQADSLVAEAFQKWQDVPTANINFNAAGKLGADVTSSNYLAFENDLNDCGNPLGSIAKDRSIVYDVDGSIVRDAIGDDPNSLLGFAFPACYGSNGSENVYTRGIALLNGQWIDGQPDSSTNGEVTLAEFRAVFIHEFGHLIGLDHSQINVNCYTSFCSPGGSDAQGLPTMFPRLFGEEQATLTPDDNAALSELYPETTTNLPPRVPYLSTTGRIRGRIFFSDGTTQVQSLNVIARRVDDPRRIAVSSVSGFLFTADTGNPVYPWPGSIFGTRDQAYIGFYEIPGLTPGDYTIEVEAINPDFVEGSGVGPIATYGIAFPIPGTCATEFANTTPPESATDSCTDQTTFSVTAGAIVDSASGTDIILNGTPPRFDAWEDE